MAPSPTPPQSFPGHARHPSASSDFHPAHVYCNPTPPVNSIVPPSCHCAGCHTHGYTHAHNNIPNYPPPQSHTWQNAPPPSLRCCSPHLSANAAQSRRLGPSPCIRQGGIGGLNLRGYTSSTQARHSAADSCLSCGTCGSSLPQSANGANMGNLHHSHIALGHVHVPVPAGSHRYVSGGVHTHNAGHVPYHASTGLCSIPEFAPHFDQHNNWYSYDQPSPSVSSGHGPYPGFLNHQTAQPGPPPVPVQSSAGYMHARTPSHNFNHVPQPNNLAYSPVMCGVSLDRQQQRPPTDRTRTDEMWRRHGDEAPPRTESPRPMESGGMDHSILGAQQSRLASSRCPTQATMCRCIHALR